MANISKKNVKAELKRLDVEFETDDYRELCDMLRNAKESVIGPSDGEIGVLETEDSTDGPLVDIKPLTETEPARFSRQLQIRLESRMPKRTNIFLADSIRNDRDIDVLNKEISKRVYKGKIKRITTVKHMEVTEDGDWLTSFIIDLKD